MNIDTVSKFLAANRTRPLLMCITLLLLAIVFSRVHFNQDMTSTSRHTLQTQSVSTLSLLKGRVDAEVFINPQDQQRVAIEALLLKYQNSSADFNFMFTDPALDPTRMRELDIAPGGEIFFHHKQRTQRITQVSEQAVTLALQRLAREQPRIASFITGHGERATVANNNGDLSVFSSQLQEAGFKVETIDLNNATTALDADRGLLVIASPLHRFQPNETAIVLDYISRGGNLLWLTEPSSDDGLKALELELGIRRLAGVVVDLAAQKLQVERPDFAIVNHYAAHQATQGFSAVTLFPQATGLELEPNREWRAAALLQAGEQAWTETGALSGEVAFGDDEREVSGPFPLILALERQKSAKKQRVLISGDGDFIADAWIGNGGNRDLGNRLFNWTADDATMIAVEYPVAADSQLQLTRGATIALFALALLLLPGILFGAATRVWYQRHHG